MADPNDAAETDGATVTRDAMAGLYAELRVAALQQIVEGSKWSTAALLTINGGGAVAAVNAGAKANTFLASTSFALGIVAVVVAVIIATKGAYKYYGQFFNYQVKTALGEPEPLEEDRSITYKVSDVLEIASLVLFVAGAYLLSESASDRNNNRRCLAIQRDMLGRSERRSDDAAMFQAFGCRPQGEQLPLFGTVPPAPALNGLPSGAAPLVRSDNR
jgi:hypothetical protein